MAIQLDPNRVRLAPGSTGKFGERRQASAETPLPPKPARAHVNHVPAPETLFTLIRSAVEAFRRGVVWDRGTILNLSV